MKKVLILVLIVITILIGSCIYYNFGLSAVSNNDSIVKFTVDSGSTYYSIINLLKEQNLIRNEFCFKLYIRINSVNNLEAGIYQLNKNMGVREIVDVLSGGNTYNPDAITITFKEGKNMRSIAHTIAEKTNNTENDVYSLLSNSEYLNGLINKYWFIDSSILNSNIYYSLEGYLYPNTYQYKNKNVTVEIIFNSMLEEMDKELSKYKNDLTNNKYSIHEILTLASIIELEGSNSDDRNGIASVFYNRLQDGWSLGSDVTTYYGAKIELSDRDLYATEIADNNSYNTRSSYLAGKLPVGPICNCSIESIVAALKPTQSDYYYFVSDKTGKTYFSKTYNEHILTRDNLIEAGLWYTYE